MLLKFGQRGGSWKNCSEIARLVKRGVLLESGVQIIVSSVFFRKACFHYCWNTFFFFSFFLSVSGKYYSRLLWLIDLLFHVVCFLLKNNIIKFSPFALIFEYIFVEILLITYFISISLKTSYILQNKSQVFKTIVVALLQNL